jgi:hypothetical protein
MKRKGRYTYVPKDEIAEVRTFNDVSFETDDLLDGAYVKGRKKYARGGMPSKRPMSLEEQAAESVGYDTWYMMDAVDQKELVDELVSTGMIAPMYGWGGKMADGGNVSDRRKIVLEIADTMRSYYEFEKTSDGDYGFELNYDEFDELEEGDFDKIKISDKLIIENDKDYIIFKGKKYYNKDLFKKGDKYFFVYYDKTYTFKPNGDAGALWGTEGKLHDIGTSGLNADLFIYMFDSKKDWDDLESEDSYMADGGELTEKESAIAEAVKIAEFAYMNDISASGNSLEDFTNKVFEASGISYAKAYLKLAYEAMKNQGFADGGEISYVVKYSMKDTPEIIKEKVFADKDAAELFHETISDDDDLVVMDLQEIKPAPAAKKSLFASAKPAPATTAASKKKRERVQVDGIEGEIARYDQLKAAINNAKAEQEVIGGRLKEIGREKFLDLYEQRGVRPANFDLADGSENILLEVTDKYLKVEPEKAELLRQFGGLLEEKTTYEFDSEILEKEVSDGMTIGDVVSMLIQDSKLIPDSDKANLIKAKMSMRVPKGTLDRLMDYDNPREVFSLISPILALK